MRALAIILAAGAVCAPAADARPRYLSGAEARTTIRAYEAAWRADEPDYRLSVIRCRRRHRHVVTCRVRDTIPTIDQDGRPADGSYLLLAAARRDRRHRVVLIQPNLDYQRVW